MVAVAHESKRRAVFLDRDGVINQSEVRNGKPFAPRDMESFRLLPDALPSAESLHEAGLLLIVITNQPDVGNGFVPKAVVEEMHGTLLKTLPVDGIKVCFHSQRDKCSCRKPQPGMLIDASREWNIDLAKSFMVGDRWSDVVVGRSQGCYTVFIDRNYAEPLEVLPDTTVASFAEAAELIISILRSEEEQRDE